MPVKRKSRALATSTKLIKARETRYEDVASSMTGERDVEEGELVDASMGNVSGNGAHLGKRNRQTEGDRTKSKLQGKEYKGSIESKKARKEEGEEQVQAMVDQFQQITQIDFVSQYRMDLGYGADVFYHPTFIPTRLADAWMEEILQLDTWYQPLLRLYGRTFPQSRQIAAYSINSTSTLKYSGSEIKMNHPFPPVLERIRKMLEKDLNVKFNHVMLNRYDDGSVYIGRHSDNLNNLVIASISLGAERTFIMSPRLPNKSRRITGANSQSKEMDEYGSHDLEQRKNVKWILGNGSLVVMQGRTQEFWKVSGVQEAARSNMAL